MYRKFDFVIQILIDFFEIINVILHIYIITIIIIEVIYYYINSLILKYILHDY